MKELIKLLGLKAKATETELLSAVTALVQHAAQVRSLLGLEASAAHDEVHDVLAKLLSAPRPAVTGGFAPEQIAAKVAAGLTREQAIEALERQAHHDANFGNDVEEQGLEHQDSPDSSGLPAAPAQVSTEASAS